MSQSLLRRDVWRQRQVSVWGWKRSLGVMGTFGAAWRVGGDLSSWHDPLYLLLLTAPIPDSNIPVWMTALGRWSWRCLGGKVGLK